MVNEASKVTVISNQAKAIDELREQVQSISAAVEAIRKTGITEEALLALIVHACPTIPGRSQYHRVKPPIRAIKAVLSGLANLEGFVFGAKPSQE